MLVTARVSTALPRALDPLVVHDGHALSTHHVEPLVGPFTPVVPAALSHAGLRQYDALA